VAKWFSTKKAESGMQMVVLNGFKVEDTNIRQRVAVTGFMSSDNNKGARRHARLLAKLLNEAIDEFYKRSEDDG
jgi:hypothetical protein